MIMNHLLSIIAQANTGIVSMGLIFGGIVSLNLHLIKRKKLERSFTPNTIQTIHHLFTLEILQ